MTLSIVPQNMPSVADHPVAPEGEAFGPGIVPPPPLPILRAPLMPMDSRGPFMRRGPPFPPVPPSGVYGPRDYFPRDFASLPRPPLPSKYWLHLTLYFLTEVIKCFQ